jgi:hypothetical protein
MKRLVHAALGAMSIRLKDKRYWWYLYHHL